MRYLDPKADLTFKKVFGEHPDLVISLLNAFGAGGRSHGDRVSSCRAGTRKPVAEERHCRCALQG